MSLTFCRSILGILWLMAALPLLVSCGDSAAGGGGTTSSNSAPVAGESISFSDIQADTVTVGWGIASDDATPGEKLAYRLVKSSTYANINTVAEVEAITGDDVVMNWTENVLTSKLENLASETVYWFSVLVRDQDGNKALYFPHSARTLVNKAPVPGTAIVFSGTTSVSTNLTWGAAADKNPEYPPSTLSYRVVKSTDKSNIDTVSEASACGDEVMAWTLNTLSTSSAGLTDGTTYYYAVLVKNPDEKAALYTPQSVTTVDVTVPAPGATVNYADTDVASVTVKWGKATDNLSKQTALQYKVVRAASAGAIDSVGEANAVTGDGVVMDWTSDVDSVPETALDDYTEYFFAVLVRDEAGLMSLYSPQPMRTLDGTAPVPQGIIGLSGETEFSIDAAWSAASEVVGPLGDLQYKLVKALSADLIDTVEEADAVTGADLVAGWTANLLGYTAPGLDDGVTYYFAVVVKDAAGNMAVYSPQSAMTLDVTNPVAGSAITITEVRSTSVRVNWGKAGDNSTLQADLEYRLVKAATGGSIDSVAEVAAITGPDLILDWNAGKDINTFEVESLNLGDTYFFSVLVRDASGNMALYSPASVTTRKSWEVLGAAGFASMADSHISLAIGAGDAIYAAFQDNASGVEKKATVMKFDGADWAAVGARGFSAGEAANVNLTVDGATPYVSFQDAANSLKATVMKYSAGWSVVGDAGISAVEIFEASLAIYGGNPRIVYWNNLFASDHKATMRSYDGASWCDVGTAPFTDGAAFGTSLAVDADGMPYVAYMDGALTNKATVMRYSSGWAAVGDKGFSAGSAALISMAIDSTKAPYAAYQDGGNGYRATVVKYNSGTTCWDALGGAGFTSGSVNSLSFAIRADIPYVAFSDGASNGKATVMKYDGGSWSAIGDPGFTLQSVSAIALAIDSTGKPYVAFRDTANTDKLTVLVYK